jgi:DNA processing protein
MHRDELGAWLRLTLSPGVGNGAARRLLARFGLPQEIFRQPESTLAQCVTPVQAKALCTVPSAWDALLDTTWQWLNGADPHGPARAVVTLGDVRYPQLLLDTEDPPLLLYLVPRMRGSFPAHCAARASPSCQAWRWA